jgi:hypothetical protein
MNDPSLPKGFTLSVVWPPDGVDGLPVLTCGPFCEPFSLSPQSIQRAHLVLAAHVWRHAMLEAAERGQSPQEHSR